MWCPQRPNPDNAWGLYFVDGSLTTGNEYLNDNFAWAVHNGDVAAIPVPAAVWLFGSGLLGLIGVARNKS